MVKSVGMSKNTQLRELYYLFIAIVTQLSELCDRLTTVKLSGYAIA